MRDGRYLMQVLVAIGRQCKPNSPYSGRAWTKVAPIYGVPEFGDALGALVRHGYLERASCNWIKPSAKGYARIAAWKTQRLLLRARPILYDRLVWDVSTAQEEYISVPTGRDALGAAHCRDIGNRRGSARPSRLDDWKLQQEFRRTKPMRGTLARAVLAGEVASDLMYRIAPRDTVSPKYPRRS